MMTDFTRQRECAHIIPGDVIIDSSGVLVFVISIVKSGRKYSSSSGHWYELTTVDNRHGLRVMSYYRSDAFNTMQRDVRFNRT